MDALVMCGGAGTRLDRGEKPLFEIGGVAMVERVIRAVESSDLGTVHAVTSPHTPETTRRLDGRVDVIEAAGDGYVEDLSTALDRVEQPVATVAADLPLLRPETLNRTMDDYESGAVTVCVPAALKRQLGVSVDTVRSHGDRELAPTGLNVVGEGDERLRVSLDAGLAVNVNRPADATVAEALVEGRDNGVKGRDEGPGGSADGS